MKSLEKQGLEFKLSHKVVATKSGSNDVEVTMESEKDKKQIKNKFNIVLMSIGRKPNTEELNLDKIGVKLNDQQAIEVDQQFKTCINGIYAIGDVAPGPMLAHKAEEEGVACVEIINGQKTHMNYDTIPAIVYTNPEVASVGKTEEQLKESKTEYKVGKFPFMANGRALTTSESEGFVKILADKKNRCNIRRPYNRTRCRATSCRDCDGYGIWWKRRRYSSYFVMLIQLRVKLSKKRH